MHMAGQEQTTRVFMVERDLPGISLEQLARAQRAAIEMSRRFARDGKPVRYMRSAYIPQEGRCMCFFEARDARMVQEVNNAAMLPYARIVEAMDLSP
jgi:hypothetical protein